MILILVPAATWSATLEPPFASRLAKMAPGEDIEVIIKLNKEPDRITIKAAGARENRQERTTRVVRSLRETADLSQNKIKTALVREADGGHVKRVTPFWIFNGFVVTATAEGIRRLAQLPEVAEIRPNRILNLGSRVTAAAASSSWNLNQVGASQLWSNGFSGQGAVVASLDTGVDLNHPALAPKWRGGTNSWFDPHRSTTTPYDIDGHGTAVTGLMVGGNTTDNPVGVAPDAQWIAAKIFDDNGNSDLATIHRAFQWVLDPDGDPATHDIPDVVNNSWDLDSTTGIYDSEFQPDIDLLRGAGIAVVFSAGNQQQGAAANSSTSPGNNPGAFPVGTIDSSDAIAFFSSRGPSPADGSIYPALTAPGINVHSTDLYGSYAGFTGTSFSAPHVSGAIALLKSALPGLTLQLAEEALRNSVVGPTGPDNTYGFGRVDVAKAYAYLALPGDVNGDGVVTMVDVLILLNAVVDGEQTTPLIVHNGAVSPLGADGRPNRSGDAAIGVGDALLVLQKALGIIDW